MRASVAAGMPSLCGDYFARVISYVWSWPWEIGRRSDFADASHEAVIAPHESCFGSGQGADLETCWAFQGCDSHSRAPTLLEDRGSWRSAKYVRRREDAPKFISIASTQSPVLR